VKTSYPPDENVNENPASGQFSIFLCTSVFMITVILMYMKHRKMLFCTKGLSIEPQHAEKPNSRTQVVNYLLQTELSIPLEVY